jgi:hypothetical protein
MVTPFAIRPMLGHILRNPNLWPTNDSELVIVAC